MRGHGPGHIMASHLLLLLLILPTYKAVERHIKIAAIFDYEESMQNELMFVNAVKNVNRLPGLLRGVILVILFLLPLPSKLSSPPSSLQVPITDRIHKDNSLHAEQVTCKVIFTDLPFMNFLNFLNILELLNLLLNLLNPCRYSPKEWLQC